MKKIIAVPTLLTLILVLVACNASPQKSPAFVKLSNRVDALEDTTTKLENSLKDMSFDIGLLDDQIETTKKSLQEVATASPAENQALEVAMKNVSELHKQVQTLQAKLEAQEKSFQTALNKQEKALESKIASAKSAPSKPRATTSTASSKTTSPTPAKKTAQNVEEEKPATGFYYKVKSGDTLSSISRRYGISVGALSKANHIPLSADILPGQSIYVPRS